MANDEEEDSAFKATMERSYDAACEQFMNGLPIHVEDAVIGAAVHLRDAMAAAQIVATSFANGPPTLDQVIAVYDRMVALLNRPS